MIYFANRNLKLFFRDKSAVFFSLLASLIIIGLYILFLGDTYTENLKGMDHADELIDNWVMAGLLAVTSVTTTLGAFGIMVNDKAQKIYKDFYASPISRRNIAGGYLVSAFAIGFIMSVITLIFAEIYIVAQGGSMMTVPVLVKVLLLVLLADLTNTAMIFFITSFFESQNAFTTASTVIGTLIGFITGIYLPIGSLPEGVQWIIKLFPTSHAAALMRQTMMEDSMSSAFVHAPVSFVSEFEESMGLVYHYGKYQLNNMNSMLILLGFALVFFLLAVMKLSRKRG